MKKTYTYFLFLCFLLVSMSSCKTSQKNNESKNDTLKIDFLDSLEASKKILVDRTDGMFDVITLADMSIQLRESNMPTSRAEGLELYKQLLRTDMSDFSTEEKVFVTTVFHEAKRVIDAINPKLWIDDIELIKTKVNHYGPDVYYTREKAIILPENIFEEMVVDHIVPVMLHEIFHILSRYNDNFRNEMYELIGFKKFSEEVIYPKPLLDRKLANPDGIRDDYAIHLKNEKGEIQRALPVVLSTKTRFQKEIPSFFSYLHFDLFPIEDIGNNQVTLGIDGNVESTLSVEHNADFFTQIKDNTQYIIHPDEILADNFMMAILAKDDDNYDRFSVEGKKLIEAVLTILENFKN